MRAPITTREATKRGTTGVGNARRIVWLALLGAVQVLAAGQDQARGENWPQWRGPRADGTSRETGLPIHWSTTENVRWHVDLPDRGNSTPIVWNDSVFLTQPLEKEGRRELWRIDKETGKILWTVGVDFTATEKTHETNPPCSPSPATDGERVVVWFGSAGLCCYDFEGKEIWRRDLGPQEHPWGHGASPVLHGDLCLLSFGPGKRSFLLAVNKRTGETVWQADAPVPASLVGQGEERETIERPTASPVERGNFNTNEYRGSWGTPLVVRLGGVDVAVASWAERLSGYDAGTGARLWHCDGLSDLMYSSPLWGDETLVVLGGYFGASLAIRPQGSGDLSEKTLWRHDRSRLRLGTGVIRQGRLFLTDMQGIAECIDLESGKTLWEKRLAGTSGRNEIWSSLLLADGLVYAFNQSGDTFVFRAGDEYELLATNALGETTNSSPVASGKRIYLRTHKGLWCIETGPLTSRGD